MSFIIDFFIMLVELFRKPTVQVGDKVRLVMPHPLARDGEQDVYEVVQVCDDGYLVRSGITTTMAMGDEFVLA